MNRDSIGETGGKNIYSLFRNQATYDIDVLGMVPKGTVSWENHHWFVQLSTENGRVQRGQQSVDRFCGQGFLNINDYTATLAGNAAGSPHKWLESPSGGNYNQKWRTMYSTIDATVPDKDKCCALMWGTMFLSQAMIGELYEKAANGDFNSLANWPPAGFDARGRRSPVKPGTSFYHSHRGPHENRSNGGKLLGLMALACASCSAEKELEQLLESLRDMTSHRRIGNVPELEEELPMDPGKLPPFNPTLPTPALVH